MDSFRHLGRKVRQQVRLYPHRRPLMSRRPAPMLEQNSAAHFKVEPDALDDRLDHREIMLIVVVAVALLALGLLGAVAALLLGWF